MTPAWTIAYNDYGDELWFGGPSHGLFTIRTSDSYEDCVFLGGNCNTPAGKARQEKIATLITAAPSLLEVCKRLLNDPTLEDDEAIRLLTEVIAQAEGTPSHS